jgi:hypothetical protein
MIVRAVNKLSPTLGAFVMGVRYMPSEEIGHNNSLLDQFCIEYFAVNCFTNPDAFHVEPNP